MPIQERKEERVRFSAPCTNCGEPTKNGNLCEDCEKAHNNRRIPSETPRVNRKKTTEKGYGHKWQRLSERARRLQPFCTDCGATNNLEADHLPEAWERYEKGWNLRLKDVEVVCHRCNVKRGSSKPGAGRM